MAGAGNGSFVCQFYFVAPAVHAEHLYAIASFLAVGKKCEAECMKKKEVMCSH